MFYVFVALGCALGGVCRYMASMLVTRLFGDAFPWGTLFVNAIGSFLLGLILGSGIFSGDGVSRYEHMHAFAAIGFCGGLTTFSTFSLQNLELLSQQATVRLLANLFGSVGLCILMVLAGYAVMEGLVI